MNNQANELPLKNALEVRGLNFFYGKFQGLKNIDLDIAEGVSKADAFSDVNL